ncbi:MAG: glycosyltransferase family A protein [Synechococcaceae cyanobacterium]|nr:glycosyltransferase family A protein [Synechococcaceae cyanobacterium]
MTEPCTCGTVVPPPPRFSVVIPVHNKGPLLAEALASVAAQSWRDYELIVVDDASSDGGLAVLERFPQLPLRLLQRRVPGPGGYAARNLGIQAARGDWVAFLDADDLWLPEHLATAAAQIERHPEAAVVCTGFEEDLAGQLETVAVAHSVCLTAAELLRRYARRDLFHTNSMLVRRQALLAAGGFPEQGVRRGGDHALWLRLVLLGEPIVLAAPVTSRYRRDHSGVVADPAAMAGRHPVAQVAAAALAGTIPLPPTWGVAERLALRRLANRKSLLWMLQRRRQGLPPGQGAGLPYPAALTPVDALRWLLACWAPPGLVRVLQRRWRRWRSRV